MTDKSKIEMLSKEARRIYCRCMRNYLHMHSNSQTTVLPCCLSMMAPRQEDQDLERLSFTSTAGITSPCGQR